MPAAPQTAQSARGPGGDVGGTARTAAAGCTAVLIVNYNTADLTVACLKSLLDPPRRIELRIFVVDNASTDNSVATLQAAIRENRWASQVSLLPQEGNGGFACGNNVALRRLAEAQPPPRHVLLLNPDTLAREGAVEALADFLDAHPSAGIAGSRLEDVDGTVQHSAHRFPTLAGELEAAACLGPLTRLLRRWEPSHPPARAARVCDWVSGAAMMVRWQVFQDVGLLDERYFLYYEEVDFCMRCRRAGWEVWHVPASRIMHLEGASAGRRPHARRDGPWSDSRRRYFIKHHGRIYAGCADLARGAGMLLWKMRHALPSRGAARGDRS